MNVTRRLLARNSLLATVALIILGWSVLRSGVLSATVVASWSYDYSRSPVCSPERPSDCIDHFEVLDITNQAKHRFIQTVKNPAVATGKTDGITAEFKYGPPYGEITFSVIAVKREKDGSILTSNPYAARAAVKIRPGVKASILFF